MAYDLIIVGSGMIGSAAAYHACLVAGKSVCLIGPPEPQSKEGKTVFGAWYDEGRMCRKVADSHTWSVLAIESMKKYQQLEKESGIDFYKETGFAIVMNDMEETQSIMDTIRRCDIEVEDVSKNWREYCGFLNLPDNACVLWEKQSGCINPRKMVKAHQKVAAENGVHIVPEVVSAVNPALSTSTNYRWDVFTEEGSSFQAKCVLVAAGAFAGSKDIFDYVAPGRVPALDITGLTVAYLRIPLGEVERLKLMPTLITKCSFGNLDGGYVLPPIQYPDGNWYLKVGHRRNYSKPLKTTEELVDWYVQDASKSECVDQLANFLRHMIPGLKSDLVSGSRCVIAQTPDFEPYIDTVAEGFGVALGGNGYAAKSCPEIGRLAARLLLLGEWDSEIPRHRVKMKWRDKIQSFK